MSASELLLAAALLTAPVGTPEQVPNEGDFPTVRNAIHKVAIDWEIMDERECNYVMISQEIFLEDLEMLRKRYVDLQDAPHLSDCSKLPSRDLIQQFIPFNRKYKQNLEEAAIWELDRADFYNRAIKETDRCYCVLSSIQDAQCEFYYCTTRRFALKKYRDSVGENNYIQGKIPSYVPEWGFYSR